MPFKLINGKRVEIDPITGQPIGDTSAPQTQPQTQPQGMDISSPTFNSQPTEPVTPPVSQSDQNIQKYKDNRNFFEKIGDFFLPSSSTTAKVAGGTINLKKDLDQADKLYAEYKATSDKYFEMGKNEKDPEKKKKFFDLAKQALDQGGNLYTDAQNNYEQSTGVKFGEHTDPFREGLGAGGEIGSYLLPQEKVAEGASLVQKILAGAKMGGKVGLLLGATSSEDLSLEDRAKNALKQGAFGGVTGGLMSAAYEIPKTVVKNVLSGSEGRLARVFKLSSPARDDLRRYAGINNFEEEILQRDGKAIAGMDYDQLLKHFGDRKEEAQGLLDEMLKNSDNTISKKQILDAIDAKMGSLTPEKGHLDIGGFKTTLEDLKNKAQALPDNVSVDAANTLKKELQAAGDAAYSPNGKPTASSSAYAEVARNIKNAIEDAFKPDESLIHDPEYVRNTLSHLDEKTLADVNNLRNFSESASQYNPIRELNKNIQLYSAARDAVATAGANDVKKMSNDIGQKFFQVLPTAISGMAMLGGAKVYGGTGAIGGFLLSQMLLGGVGAGRAKYFTPEVQTKLADVTSSILSNQGVQNADRVAEHIIQEMARVAVVRNSTKKFNEVGQSQEGQPENGNNVIQQNGGNAANSENNQGVHAPSMPQETDLSQTVTIKNSQTGETKTVKKSELSQYGLDTNGQPLTEGATGGQSGMPSKDDILAAMAVDLEQTGGKNLAKLNTFLTAVESVDKLKGGNLSATEKAAVQEAQNGLNLLDTVGKAYGELQTKGLTAKEGGINRFIQGAKGQFAAFTQEGTNGAAAAAYNDSVNAFLSKLSRATGEKGVLNNQDIERIQKAIPKFTDTPETAQRKLQFVRDIIQGAIDSKMKNPLGDTSTAPASVPTFQGDVSPF